MEQVEGRTQVGDYTDPALLPAAQVWPHDSLRPVKNYIDVNIVDVNDIVPADGVRANGAQARHLGSPCLARADEGLSRPEACCGKERERGPGRSRRFRFWRPRSAAPQRAAAGQYDRSQSLADAWIDQRSRRSAGAERAREADPHRRPARASRRADAKRTGAYHENLPGTCRGDGGGCSRAVESGAADV